MLERTCDLCTAERLTTWYVDDDVCWVADCEICDVPMVVWRPHGTEPPADALAHMRSAIDRVAAERFADFWIDGHRRNIPDHWHAHARPKGAAALRWWTRRMTR